MVRAPDLYGVYRNITTDEATVVDEKSTTDSRFTNDSSSLDNRNSLETEMLNGRPTGQSIMAMAKHRNRNVI